MTKIEWCAKPGYKPETWNPVTGCTPISEGCANCYAKRIIGRNLHGYDFTPRVHPERLDIPLRWRKPRFIFVCSMGDLFHEDVPFEFIDKVLARIALQTQHRFVILTKRPDRMLSYFCPHPDTPLCELPESRVGRLVVEIARNRGENTEAPMWDIFWTWPIHQLWLGVTAENQVRADERIPVLLQIPAAVRFVSVEPMLGVIDIASYISRADALSWVICGGESGPGARPMHPDWARSLRDQCRAANVPFFFKQWGEWSPKVNEDVPYGEFHGSGDWVDSCLCREGTATMYRVGKKAAGALLDGELIREYPE